MKLKKSSPLKLLSQSQPNFAEMILGWSILVGVLKCRTHFWKRTTQESFQQSLVEIGLVVSEEKIFLISSPLFSCVRQRRPVSKMAAITKNRNFLKWPKLLYFKLESAQI
jgi:hypothetical protein